MLIVMRLLVGTWMRVGIGIGIGTHELSTSNIFCKEGGKVGVKVLYSIDRREIEWWRRFYNGQS